MAGGKKLVEVDGHMRPVEIPDADMQNSWGKFGSVIGGNRDPVREEAEIVLTEWNAHFVTGRLGIGIR
ncbi:hypothetical protein GCM10007874_54000 [Labrys miyagiensis]|uniref:Uncharacterized protein n=1 Tax=Labrys miyagiensis TaxID=346912 RepID=A0ABQ6CPV8_9HYPH|nr:hypothetical protein GCM10007874_54000 [Labrys miyagiensis]